MVGAWTQCGGKDSLRAEQNDCRGERDEINMLAPAGGAAARNPMRVDIAEQQRDLEKDQARQPDRGGAAQERKKLLGGHRLYQEEQECAEKDGDAVEQAGCGHGVTRSSRGLMDGCVFLASSLRVSGALFR